MLRWSITMVVLAGLPAAALADSGAREHDGFYLRLGVGPGYATGSRSVDATSDGGGGIAVNSEVAIGATVARGLVVGGGTYPMVMPAPSYGGGNHFSATGVFADWYFDPSRGLHAQAGLLFAAGYAEEDADVGSAVGFGFGAMLGIGYELWIGDQWSLGPLLRFVYYHWGAETDAGQDVGIDLMSTALLAAVTYH